MHAWFKPACVVLAWTILSAGVLLAGLGRPVHPVQVSTRTKSVSSTSAHPAAAPVPAALTSITAASPAQNAQNAQNVQTTRATRAASAAPASPARSYVVQRGDNLSVIAARFGVRGGWPALYAANRAAIGPDPDTLGVGLHLHLPGPAAPVRYTVAAGDTLSAIAARFGVRGGWPSLYAANRAAVGANPDALAAGIRLTIPSPATSPASGSAPGNPGPSAPGTTAPSGTAPTSPAPSSPPAAHHTKPHASSGMPSWLKTVLLAIGLLVVLVFAAEPLLLARRRRRRRGAASAPVPHQAPQAPQAPRAPQADPTSLHQERSLPEIPVMPVPAQEGRIEPARIVMADHDRVVVTRSKRDDTICVLRPPGEDPADILRVARLVLPEGHYGKLAEQLGVSANWPMNQ